MGGSDPVRVRVESGEWGSDSVKVKVKGLILALWTRLRQDEDEAVNFLRCGSDTVIVKG